MIDLLLYSIAIILAIIFHDSIHIRSSRLKQYIFYSNSFIEWMCRILVTVNVIIPGINYSDHAYPLDVLVLTVLSFWLYIYRLKVFAIIILLFCLFINYLHLGLGQK